jgi:predicted O-methyltransferase YrrM
MTNTLIDPKVTSLLQRLFEAAQVEEETEPELPRGFDYSSATAKQRADAMQDIYMPISAAGGNLLYGLVRSARPETVVEFGTSYGISTLFLAAAVSDNGVGHVFTTELSEAKVALASANLVEAGLADAVTVLAGDARETLKQVKAPIGVLLLDGWKDACLPVLRMLEDKLAPGAIVVADDVTFESMGSHLDYVRDPANGYVSVNFPVEDGMEVSCRATA